MKENVLFYLMGLSVATIMGYPSRLSSADLDATPRITIVYNALKYARRFSSSTQNYTTLLLEEEKGILYVGARGAIFSLSSSNISDITDGSYQKLNWEASPEKQAECLKKGKNNKTECYNHVKLLQRLNSTHLYACGTYAFHPLCAYIDTNKFVLPSHFEEGKEKCPYDPSHGYTGLIVDGGLYTATRYEFRSLPDIRRNRHQRVLRTEESPLHWLNDAEFVASVLVRESTRSSVGDDDKIYYFFTERAGEESTSIFEKTQVPRVARVARVCKNDLGGKKILQRKWTSFMKARLVCYIPYYEVLKDVASLDGGNWTSTVFYATFILSAQWRSIEVSAVCRYNISEVRAAFEGAYMEYQDSSRKWSQYTGDVPEPRPGSCITNRARKRGYNSSQDLPNGVLDFIKLHPLMYDEVKPTDRVPLLIKKNVVYTQVAVDRVQALDGHMYDILFLGTGNGWIHKAVVIGSTVHITEEMQVFKNPQPVENIVISKQQRYVYVGAQSGVLQLPLSTCSQYISCFSCILARDPYCAWDGKSCREVADILDRSLLIQDVLHGNMGCWNDSVQAVFVQKNRTVLHGGDVLLPCEQTSNLARATWMVNGTKVFAEDGQGHFRLGVDGLLVTDTQLEYSGEYQCYAEENGLQTLLATYTLTVLPKELGPQSPGTPTLPSWHLARDDDGNVNFIYIVIITVLSGLCFVLMIVLFYVCCLQRRRGKYQLGGPQPSSVELQTVSSNCLSKGRQDEEELSTYPDGCLQIIPGEATTLSLSPKVTPLALPPPPPPLPAEFTNGISTLPNMLRKMNGNSYMLLRQNEEPCTSPLYNSFTEELSKILEKRKHTQLVEKLDESSV
ncbi:semaphorin-4G [Pantherophis guttatus]|uniref:Semaphorin-4G n=1 Tax=Pantherophis guttatus TaxID=94885 RepID=A0A6P9DIW3_PANGU|nr:semaphorin-4G [Pantherophis guttatus]XP_034295844.1 semaphorin-4G [Pantherophis guttatus]XP_034295845.1 semaphorin-4G [Pantherophis guttatus]XP_034295847.1 semaphorin-4G [Pantherophis guttatus]XP_060538919.1 semaphorin-4G [Pantherophis guttatus]